MAQYSDAFHGLPTLASPAVSPGGRHSLTAHHDHPKQPQQHHSPCTTQASPPVLTDDQVKTLDTYSISPAAPSPEGPETFAPADGPDSSRSPRHGPDGSPPGAVSDAQEDLVLGDESQDRQYSPGELQQRIEDMWPNQPACSDRYDTYAPSLRVGCSTDPPPRTLHVFDSRALAQETGWPTSSQSLLQPLPWKPFQSSTQHFDQQSFPHQGRLGFVTAADEVHAINSSSCAPHLGTIKPDFDVSDADCLNSIPTTTSLQDYSPFADSLATRSDSPCTRSLFAYDTPRDMRQAREDNLPLSPDEGLDMVYKDDPWYQDDVRDDSPGSIDLSGGRVDEPYAQLIYKAFMSRPNRSMTLQDIYKWFRENTDKAKSEGKGWMNSIRHNLSMNGAFTKRNSKAAIRNSRDGSLSFDAAVGGGGGDGGRKSTEWFLEPDFYGGVESTTRYRRGNSGGSRSRAGGGSGGGCHARLGGARPHDGGGGYSHARVSAGRKGGNVAAQNRRRHAERQQQARAMAVLARGGGELRQLQMGGLHDGLPMQAPYPSFLGHDSGGGGGGFFQADYTSVHPTSSPFPPGLAAVAPQPGGRHLDINYFSPQDVGHDAHARRSRTLVTDNDNDNDNHSEPTTPPGGGSDDHPLGPGGSKHHGGEYLPGLLRPFDHPLHQHYQGHAAAMVGAGHGGGGHVQSGYTMADVTGVFDPALGPQPPLFLDETADLMSLLD